MYLFGSVLNLNISHSDIDILTTYVKYSSEISSDIRLISCELEKESVLPIDLMVLSIEEEKILHF